LAGSCLLFGEGLAVEMLNTRPHDRFTHAPPEIHVVMENSSNNKNNNNNNNNELFIIRR